MDFISGLFNPKPPYVKDILKIVDGYFVDISGDIRRPLRAEAVFI